MACKNVSKNVSKYLNVSNIKPRGLMLDTFKSLDTFLDTFLQAIFLSPYID